MRITADAAALKAALARTAKIIKARNTIPVLSTVRISADDGIALTATDLEMWASLDIDGEVSEAGAACIPAAELTRLVGLAKKGRVTIHVSDGVAGVKFDRSSAQIHALPAEDFPLAEFPEDLPVANGPLLAAALRFCLPAVSTDETRYFLNGVNLEAAGNDASAAATDGHRIHYAEMPGAGLVASGIVPVGAAQMIADMAAQGGAFRFRCDGSMWAAQAEGCRMKGSVIDGTFPDWRRVVGGRCDLVAVVSAEDLTMAADVAMVGSDDRSRALVIDAEGGQITVTGDAGGPNMAAPGSHSFIADVQSPARAGVNGRYLAATLAAIGDAAAMFVWDGGLDFTPVEQSDSLRLHARIMGLRINAVRAAA